MKVTDMNKRSARTNTYRPETSNMT